MEVDIFLSPMTCPQTSVMVGLSNARTSPSSHTVAQQKERRKLKMLSRVGSPKALNMRAVSLWSMTRLYHTLLQI